MATDGSGSRFRSALVVAQVALSLTLLVSGGLFVRSLDRARSVDLGFDPDGMFLASAAPGIQGYDVAQRLAFYRSVRDRIAAHAWRGEAAAWISLPPTGHHRRPRPRCLRTPGRPIPTGGRPAALRTDVSPEYFAAARVPLVEGRLFDARDDAGEDAGRHRQRDAGAPVLAGAESDRAHAEGRRRHRGSRRRRAQRQVS